MKKGLIILACAAFCVTQAFAVMTQMGTRELSVSGNIDKDDELNIDLTGSAGYFIRDNIEVGVMAGVGWFEGGDWINYGVGVFGEYNLVMAPDSPMVPYVGAAGGVEHWAVDTDFGDDSETAIEVMGYGGLKFYLVENLAISTALRIMFATEDIYWGDDEWENTDWDAVLRTSFYF